MSEAGDRDAGRTGTLHVVATPIGNLGDVSRRARDVLEACDLVLCEDTRRTGRLLKELGVKARLRTCHEHDEERRIPEVLDLLRAGRDIALVSDAGTPTLSDPGHGLVAAAVAAGLRVSPVPGPSAILAALCACGLSAARFAFEGFPPRRAGPRRRLFAELAREPRTLVLLEAPHRVAATLDDLAAACGADRPACLARELTKLHEEFLRGTLGELARRVAESPVRGEVVLVVQGAPKAQPGTLPSAEDARARMDALRADGLDERTALKELARELGVGRRDVYRLLKVE